MTTLIYILAAIGAVSILAVLGLLICTLFDNVNPTQQALDDVEHLLANANKPTRRAY